MGLLVVIPTWHLTYHLWLYRCLRRLQPHISIAAACTPGDPQWSAGFRTVNLDEPAPLWERALRRTGIPGDLFQPVRQRRLEQAVRDSSVDAVLIHFLDFALKFSPVWEQTGKPIFVHCHGPMDINIDFRDHRQPDQTALREGYRDAVVRFSKRVVLIANSHWTAGCLTKMGAPSDRIVVKHLGVPVPDRPPVRKGDSNGLNILYLNQLVDWKGPDRTIQAFELACSRGLDGTLTIAGDGPLRPMCELTAARSPYASRIRLAGEVGPADADRLRAQADCFTAHHCEGEISHAQEAFGVSVVEAMAAALPVVTGRSGALSETVEHGRTGWLVEPGDIEAHADALLRLSRDPALRSSMGEAGWLQAKERFSLEGEVEKLLGIIYPSARSERAVGGDRQAVAAGYPEPARRKL
ncbi:MAG: glycosyltransferase family 4 protein [Candidatus Omnitrophica bacterium]|nr:glycosyltransferase family 4 protein [Candidatus Omnitrophota bacterium]